MSVTTGRRATAQPVRSTLPDDASKSAPAAGANGAASHAPRRADLRLDVYDRLLVVVLGVATVLVHPVSDMLSHAYWFDETWVAVLTKAPLARLARMTSSAPVGFVLLLKLVPDAGGQRGRMVVLGFAVLTVVAAYLLVRTLAWKGSTSARIAAVVAALVVMLAPVSLTRNDLKQYTCDAFAAVLLLAVGARAEREGTRQSLVVLGVTAILAVPFSSTALFVAVAVLLGLFVAACTERAYTRVRDLIVAGVVIGGALLGYYALAIAPNVNDKLQAYWSSQYLSGSFGHTMALVWRRLAHTDSLLGAPAWLLVALFVIGVVVLTRVRARSIAIAVPVLWVEMIVAGHAQRYPFLDQRTSHFLFVSSLIVVALGAVGVVGLLSRLWLTKRPLLGTGLAAAAAVALAAVFIADFHSYVHVLNIPTEDVRSETVAVAARRQPHDVILVSSAANFGFAYYWPHNPHLTFHDDDTGQAFAAHVTGINAINVPTRDYVDVLAGVQRAVDRLRAAPPGSRLYIVRSHMSTADYETWDQAFRAVHVEPREDVVGSESLLVLDRSALQPS